MVILNGFPNTVLEPVLITSPATWTYNCIGWAYGDDTRWYWPTTDSPHHYWPPGILRELNLQSFIELYQLAGYQVCANSAVEIGIEKIAIFAHPNNEPTHAARQLPNGNWTSKMGPSNDVEHTLNALCNSPWYGSAAIFMSRPRNP
jgi:hypothetical protein